MTETATTAAPTIAANTKVVDLPDAASKILAHANGLDADARGTIDADAFRAFARHMVNKWDGDNLAVDAEPTRHTLPVYATGNKGVGSVRYTRQRAALLLAIAEANNVAGELAFTRYTYPNPQTSRRNHYVNLFGAKVDVARTLTMFEVLEQRAIKDAYRVPMAEGTRPADQTKIRRAFLYEWIEELATKINAEFDATAEQRKADGQLSDRASRAQEALTAYATARAASADEDGEQRDTTAE